MNEAEYKNIHQYENSYWWYLVLDDLVEYYVSSSMSNGPLKLLDAGCGTGRAMKKLLKYGEVFGIDFSPTAIKICKERGLKNIQVADLNTWKSEQKYNMILSLDVLYHQSLTDYENILGSFHDTLLDDGILILNLPAFNILKRQHDIVVGGGRRFRKQEIKNVLIKKGFAIDTITYRYPLLFLFIAVKKIFVKNENKIDSDLGRINPIINNMLYFIHKIENEIIKMGISIPFGSSIFVVVKKTKAISTKQKSVALGLAAKFKRYIMSRKIYNQLIKYSVVGLFNTTIGLAVIFLFYNIFHVNYIVSNIFGYLAGLINSFIWNKRWTFHSEKHYSKEIFPFLIVFALSFLLNLIVVVLSVELLQINPNIAQILGITAYSLCNFFINKYWTFSIGIQNQYHN